MLKLDFLPAWSLPELNRSDEHKRIFNGRKAVGDVTRSRLVLVVDCVRHYVDVCRDKALRLSPVSHLHIINWIFLLGTRHKQNVKQ